MNKKNYLTLPFIVFLIFLSCENNNKGKIIFNWIGEKIVLIDTLPVYLPQKNTYISFDKFNMEKEKIVVYIDGECFTCAEDFLEWKNIVKDFENENIEILFYLHVSDFEILKPYLKKWNFSYPIIWDRYNQFFISNKLSNDRLFQVMLLDNNEKVKFVGNPLCHEGIKEFYYKYLGVNNMN